MFKAVIPAKAGIHNLKRQRVWIPAFAGMKVTKGRGHHV
jgi:hypothetical protein